MLETWQVVLLQFLQTFTQILTAGVAITAFSLLLYAFTFNLRDRVARSFALILICVVIVFTADALGSTVTEPWEIELWLRLQWVGIILLPATYLHFSDALLATTGKISRGKRRWAVRFSYFISTAFLVTLPFGAFVGEIVIDQSPAPYLEPTYLTAAFLFFYVVLMVLSWFNFYRAYQRTTNSTSRRRMAYLITGAASPALGSFPFLLFGSGFAGLHHILFWMVAFLSNMLVGVLMVVMAYAVAFFGVSWPDRVVKARLFKWLMRGPLTASLTLGLTTIVRRLSEGLGFGYSALVPIVMAGSVVVLEYTITLFAPLGERFLFDGNDRTELELLRTIEDRLLTENDLVQFLEMILAAFCDRMQAAGAYLVSQNGDGLEFVVKAGQIRAPSADDVDRLFEVSRQAALVEPFNFGDYRVFQLCNEESLQKELLGYLVVFQPDMTPMEQDEVQSVHILIRRMSIALRDRKVQQQVYQSLLEISPEVDMIQSLRAAGRYNESRLLESESDPESDMFQWVKDALTHFWGGPKLTESPLIQLEVVQEAAHLHEENLANALRAVLREAIERIKPEGERRYTSEWILYNILDMKFMEGRKVREIAMRLSMSEADLYRKQRIAIEAVGKMILEMESQAHDQESSKKTFTGQGI